MHRSHVHDLCSQPRSITWLYMSGTHAHNLHAQPKSSAQDSCRGAFIAFLSASGFPLFVCLFVSSPVLEGKKDGRVFSTSGSLGGAFLNVSLSCMPYSFRFQEELCATAHVPAACEYFM